jgi:cytoskeletal protein CcmA (bactofilin family)
VQIDIDANSTIGEESFFEGKFSIRGSLRIDGRFEGQALLVDQLQVGPKGRVKTNIVATSIVVEGLVLGNMSATRRILLLSTARVLGDLKTPELIIQDGVILEGHCTISHVQIENTPEYIQGLYNRK